MRKVAVQRNDVFSNDYVIYSVDKVVRIGSRSIWNDQHAHGNKDFDSRLLYWLWLIDKAITMSVDPQM